MLRDRDEIRDRLEYRFSASALFLGHDHETLSGELRTSLQLDLRGEDDEQSPCVEIAVSECRNGDRADFASKGIAGSRRVIELNDGQANERDSALRWVRRHPLEHVRRLGTKADATADTKVVLSVSEQARFLTATEAAAALGVSYWTLRRLVDDGALRAIQYRRGGHLRFRREDVERLLKPEGEAA